MDKFTEATRQHFYSLHMAIGADTIAGIDQPNDPQKWVAYHKDLAERSLAGEFDHNFSHLQHAHFLRTGQWVPLLP